jgi:cytoskeleton protein RodZ
MNNEFTQTTLNQSSQTPTASNALSSAREAMKLSTAEIANQLNLTVNIVERLETNQFADIAPIFVRGYIRSYAKLVKLPDNITQEIVDSVVEKEAPPLVSAKLQTTRFIKERKPMPRIFIYGLFVIILAAGGVYWKTTHQTKVVNAATTAESITAEPQALPATMTDPLPATSESTTAPTDPDALTPADEAAAAQNPAMPIVVDVPAETGTVTVTVTPDAQQVVTTSSE